MCVGHNHFSAVILVLSSLGNTRAPWPRSHWRVHCSHLCIHTVLQKETCSHFIFKLSANQGINTTLLTRGDYLELVSFYTFALEVKKMEKTTPVNTFTIGKKRGPKDFNQLF